MAPRNHLTACLAMNITVNEELLAYIGAFAWTTVPFTSSAAMRIPGFSVALPY